jgi:O-acetyl-ADP-ribose deacetylase (regulator of RNase III)
MTNKRIYKFGNSTLILEFGDITESTAQVLVSSDDYYITMGGGVSLSILEAGGNAIALDASKKVPAALGDVVVTTAGRLPAQYIFHAITIGPNDKKMARTEIVRRATQRCMQLLDTLQLYSIAFPAIGSGAAGFNLEIENHKIEEYSPRLKEKAEHQEIISQTADEMKYHRLT